MNPAGTFTSRQESWRRDFARFRVDGLTEAPKHLAAEAFPRAIVAELPRPPGLKDALAICLALLDSGREIGSIEARRSLPCLPRGAFPALTSCDGSGLLRRGPERDW